MAMNLAESSEGCVDGVGVYQDHNWVDGGWLLAAGTAFRKSEPLKESVGVFVESALDPKKHSIV
jgi:hypothetical protein